MYASLFFTYQILLFNFYKKIMKIQNNKDDFYSWDKDDKSQEHEFSSSRKRFLLNNYWKNIPHVPDTDYYSHED